MIDTILSPHTHHEKKKTLATGKLLALTLAIGLGAGIIGGIGTVVFLSSNPSLFKSQIGKGGASLQESGKNESTMYITEESGTVAVVKKTSPSVVSIIATKELQEIYRNDSQDFFNDFFGGIRRSPRDGSGTDSPRDTNGNQKKEKQRVGGGSGFIISSDGMILTNKHVVDDTQAEYTAILNDGKEYKLTILAKDQVNDIAIAKIDKKNLPFLELGDSDNVQIGQTVIAIGNTLGEYRNTVTKGVISGINRVVQAAGVTGESETIQEALQTDAAINPGNSGGPLLNLAGQVIGMNTAVSSNGQSVGFAIPISVARASVDSLKKNGKIVRPWLGIRYTIIDETLAQENNLPVTYGVIVSGNPLKKQLGVIAGSPAEKAGLMEGDIILEVNGKKIDQSRALVNEIARYKPGDTVTLQIISKGTKKEVKVFLEEYKEQK